ncbi:endolytic transglycosylase MltG [Mycolicibacterium hodleri]|uniref:Endolytic murein transglycosylase n=1 Tax=Mycolicibacterium hodleri TaxID=49897 RepID=A0A502E3X0_9MYCO|nr:endolytic transglycosylase MltG [Mycolicibacterium hodleri]TPG31472.1 endolytic transglycosylase MltG [Mycolicibacterium hodleri]
MADEWSLDRTEPEAVGRPRRTMSRTERARANRNRRRRRHITILSVVALVVVVVGAVFLGSRMWHGMFGTPSDYDGDGVSDIVVQVRNGDSTTAIGKTLKDGGVVATAQAFVDAAAGNSAISAIQPGFYKVRTEISAANAVTRLADPQNRVGRLVIPEGRQLDDIAEVKTGAVTEGIFSLIADATCVTLDDQQKCGVKADELKNAAGAADLAALDVPAWAVDPVTALGADHRRIEGLIAPGTWNIDPSAPAQDILATLIAASTAQYEQNGLLEAGNAENLSPYQILVVASLVQRESKPQDFAKVARVIYNRLVAPDHRRLEFDSTVNYSLDRQEVATTDADRGRNTPWNTYVREGLPATPICSPGLPAVAAAETPEQGDWLYFVTIDMQGTTLFTRDYQQHLANIELARRNGVLDSAR